MTATSKVNKPTPRTDAIVARLHLALKEQGAKAILARRIQEEFGHARQTASNRVSTFLHQKTQPRSEITLFILEFLKETGY